MAPRPDVPQPHGAHELAASHRRKREAFGGHTSVAQALAGARVAVLAKAGIEQRFASRGVGSPLRTDRERSGLRDEASLSGPNSSHGTSVLACRRTHEALTEASSEIEKG